jgi:hypothetical protein
MGHFVDETIRRATMSFTACPLSDSKIIMSGRLFAAMLLAPMLAISVTAQQAATATIEGIVTDPNGAVVPGATVTVKNTDTSFTGK